MRVVIQRVKKASVEIDGKEYSSIHQGFLVLLGICHEDAEKDADLISRKIANMRIFEDDDEKMNLSLDDVGGEVLVVSQFTLYGDCRKGYRPSFIAAARPETAVPLYERVCRNLADALGKERVKTGVFGADMQVGLVNDGPVTIIISSEQLKERNNNYSLLTKNNGGIFMHIQTIPVTWLQTNCYIIIDEGNGTDEESGKSAIIDPGEFSGNVREAAAKIGGANIETILLTHCHYDHVGGVKDLKEWIQKEGGNAKIVIHEADAAGLADSRIRLIPADVPAPDSLVRDGDEIRLGGTMLRVVHTPGHTIGGACFLSTDVERNAIFTGDTLFLEECGRTDLPTGDYPALMKSLKRLAGLPGDYDVYPGHGPATTMSHERKFNPYMNQ